MTNTLSDALDYQVLASGFDHVEGICWDPARACLWAGGEAGQVYRIELDGTVDVVTTIDGGALLGLALDAQRRACTSVTRVITRSGRWTPTSTCAPFGDAIDYPNYPAFAPDGRLFVSDSGDFATATGALVVIDADGTTSRVADAPAGLRQRHRDRRHDALGHRIGRARGERDVARRRRPRTRHRVGTLRARRAGLRRRRRAPDLVLPTEPTVALDARRRDWN